jgi:adenylate cyclase
VRLVKLIGDAAMLVSSEPRELVAAALALIEAAEQGGGGVPAAARRGRLRHSARARRRLVRASGEPRQPGHGDRAADSVLVTEEAREAAADGFKYSFAGERRLKGIQGRVRLFRVRREADA